MSPRKKKLKRSPMKIKRENDSEDLSRKRAKAVKSEDEELKARKKRNFVEACRQVSCSAFRDHRARLLLLYYLPSCMKTTVCKHHDKNGINIKQMPPYAEESFNIEIRNNMWYEALEVCHMCITPEQYLSANVLKEVVEIMLNAHEDDISDYTVSHIIDKCQQILSQNFSTHPPCLVKSLRSCYSSFLTSPMELKEKTYTNRTQYESRNGIVKYCMNRLEYEISSDSQDGPLVHEKIPEEMKQSLKGLHWQKEKLEIFELLNRSDRIERLMAVLESVIELLQFDLAIWHSRHTNIMRSQKPLMAFVLWSDNVMYTGAVNNNCRQILRLFAQLIHLQYPDSMLRIITTWLNTMIQTFYICELSSNSDYPNIGKYCRGFAKEFYKIISDMPYESISRILERIEPKFMTHLMGVLHIKKLHPTKDDCIISILINFFKESQWQLYPQDDNEIQISKSLFFKTKKIKRIMNYVIHKSKTWTESVEKTQYAKLDKNPQTYSRDISLKHLVHTLYITLEAYLDTYEVHLVLESWDKLNEQILDDDSQIQTKSSLEHSPYYVTEEFIKKYKLIIKTTKELQIVFHNLKSSGEMPDILEIFTNIKLLKQYVESVGTVTDE